MSSNSLLILLTSRRLLNSSFLFWHISEKQRIILTTMSQEVIPDVEYVTCVVKALISSRKQPAFLKDILKDYVDIEGEELPYRSLGYKSAQEFLIDTDKFIMSNCSSGDVIITAKSKKSAHIQEMIVNHKNEKPYKSMRKPRCLHETEHAFEDHNNNNSQYSNHIINKPSNSRYEKLENIQLKGLRDVKHSKNKLQQTCNSKVEYHKLSDFRPILGVKNTRALRETDEDSIKQLADYCRIKGYEEPEYSITKLKSSKTYLCMVCVNDCTYSTYPHEYETEYLANEACAIKALQILKNQDVRKSLPSCSFSQTEFLDKLYEELLKHPSGIFAKKLSEVFEDKFGQSLPENWWTLVLSSKNFVIETGVPNRDIIFANQCKDEELQQQTQSQQEQAKLHDSVAINNRTLLLPWSEDCWNIYITHCISTTEIWGRLFGSNYHVRFELLMDEIKTYMEKQKIQALPVNTNEIYLIYVNESWYRIQVKELDTINNKALCHFIDFGDSNWALVSQLFECKTKFLNLPGQAVQFSLHGLEDFENNPYAHKCIYEVLHAKAFVGKVLTKEKDFCSNAESNCRIQVVLFDTSSEEDINLNDRLLDAICSVTPPPIIKENELINAIVTNICNDGHIYLQLQNFDVQYIQGMIEQTVKSKLQVEKHKVTCEDLLNCAYFLICDDVYENTTKWYRGKLADNEIHQLSSDNFELFYIDFGLKRRVHISKIFLLENLSVVLTRFPPQAIKVRLHNIPNVTSEIVAQMRNILPLNCKTLVKMVETDLVPLVNLYVRMNVSGPVCHINEAIRFEYELERLSKNVTSNIEIAKNKIIENEMDEPKRKYDILKKLDDYNSIPNIGENFQVRIALSASPSYFVVQPYDHYKELQSLMKELQIYCATNNKTIAVKETEIGQAYAAKNPDGFYHRAIAVKKYGDITHLVYCDFGDTGAVTCDQLKILPNEFRQLPKMAIKAKLFGIKAIGDDWTLNDCVLFRKLTVGKKFVAIVKGIRQTASESSEDIVELELIDVSTQDDVYIHKILLTEKCAMKDC